jgi:hypothetical protein
MKDEIRKQFEQAISKAHNREVAAEKAQQRRASEREEFEADYERTAENVILPALKEIAQEVLEPAGWSTDVGYIDPEVTIRLVIRRGEIRSMIGGHPTIFFSRCRFDPKVLVSVETRSYQGGESYRLDEITADFVHQRALSFFEKVAAGH